jgi:hypothetical protein
MNIGQFRRHLETLPDDALVVFESDNTDTSLAFCAMAVSFTVKLILLPDGKETTGISIEILTNDRPYRVLRGIEYAETDATAAS